MHRRPRPTSSSAVDLQTDRYPRASAYDPTWILDNLTGPNPLWLTEALVETMALSSGMRVLDIGCGRALSSIFLAKEFGAQVWATDLWTPASHNWQRIRAAGVDHLVVPLRAEAHRLPFADDFFDAIVSIDAYHYWGTDDRYLADTFAPLVARGGQIGIVVPALTEELDTVPPHLLPTFADLLSNGFHSPSWWRDHWVRSTVVEVTCAEALDDGPEIWARSAELRTRHLRAQGQQVDDTEQTLLRADAGKTLTMARIVAHRR